MRLWSLHPRYLDSKGLVALWREALLAKAVLSGRTRGYRQHPQLARFRAHPEARAAINAYLAAVHEEARARGYDFDRSKVGRVRPVAPIATASGQVAYEWSHLLRKLAARDRAGYLRAKAIRRPACHPLFRRVRGPVADWERP